MTSLGEKLFGLNSKCPFLSFTYPITYKVDFWYFKSLCNRDRVSNRTCQNFRDKRLVRQGSKCPNWQRSQPISYKAKFSQRYNIYLVDLKCNITYQNIRGKTKVKPVFIPWNAWNGKKLPYNLHRWTFYKTAKFVLNKKGSQWLTTISVTKAWSDPKVNP